MEEKKSKHLRLEGRRNSFFLMGMVCALSLTLIAFEWKTDYQAEYIAEPLEITDWGEELPPITPYRKKAVALPEPTPKNPNMTPDQGFVMIDDFERPTFQNSSQKKAFDESGDVDVFEGLEEEPLEEEGYISVDPGVLDIPIEAKETMPTFCECEGIQSDDARKKCNDELLQTYLGSNLRYPHQELDLGVEGTAFVQYVVSRKGQVEQIRVGSHSEGFKAEAKRVVSNLPCIRPAYQNGHTVAVRYVIPIHFKIH
ncbi:energy transducer TonB [bacterium SCSIO 12741]|nr:energy transducer TonB [bacterium SCSIO 12741]